MRFQKKNVEISVQLIGFSGDAATKLSDDMQRIFPGRLCFVGVKPAQKVTAVQSTGLQLPTCVVTLTCAKGVCSRDELKRFHKAVGRLSNSSVSMSVFVLQSAE